MSTREKILQIIKKRGETSPDSLTRELLLSRQIVHRHLSRLLESGDIERIGHPPKVYYRIRDGLARLKIDEDTPLRGRYDVIESNYS